MRIFCFLVFIGTALAQVDDCTGLSSAQCERSADCRGVSQSGDSSSRCVSKNCAAIPLSFELVPPYGCPTEFCILDKDKCINKSFLDTLVEGVFAAETEGEVPIRYLFWCMMLCLSILLVLFKMPRMLAYALSTITWFVYLKKSDDSRYNSSIYIGSFSMALLGGKIRFTDVEFMSIDQNIRVSEIIFCFRWWLPLHSVAAPSKEKGKVKLSRFAVYFKGLEINVYNNSAKFNELQSVLLGKSDDLDKGAVSDALFSNLPIGSLPWFYKLFPIVEVRGEVVCVYLGEPRLPSSLVLHIASITGTHFAVTIPEFEPNVRADQYRTKNKFLLDKIQIKTSANKNFRGMSSLQASLSEVLLGMSEKGLHADGSTKKFEFVRDLMNYVKFTPPDFSVGLTGGDFQDSQRKKSFESQSDSESEHETDSVRSLSRNSSFLQILKSSNQKLPVTVAGKREDSWGDLQSWRSSRWFSRFGKSKKSVSKPKDKAQTRVESGKVDFDSVLFSSDKALLLTTLDVPGPKRYTMDEAESGDFDGFPKCSVEVELGSDQSVIEIKYGPWHDMLRHVFQDRFFPDVLKSFSYDFASVGLREPNEVEIKVVTKCKTLVEVPYRGRDPESMISDSLDSYLSRSSVETGKLYAAVAERLGQYRHGKNKQSRAAVEVKTPSAAQKLRSQVFSKNIEKGPQQERIAWNNIDWLAASPGLYSIEQWPKVLKNILEQGWVLDSGLLQILELREQYLDSRSLSKFHVKAERQKVIDIRFYQACLLNIAELILRADNSQDLLDKFSLLTLAEAEAISAVSLAKRFWSDYSCQDALLVKEMRQLKRHVDRSLLDTFFKSAKGLPLSPLFEERMTSSKMFASGSKIIPGTEVNFVRKAIFKAKSHKKWAGDLLLLEETLPLLASSTARLPRWLNIYDSKFEEKKTNFEKKKSKEMVFADDKEFEVNSTFISPESFAHSKGLVLKWFSLEFEASSTIHVIYPFFSIDAIQTTTTCLLDLKNAEIYSSQTASHLLKSPSLNLRFGIQQPNNRSQQIFNLYDFQFTNAKLFFSREHDFTINELIADWTDTATHVKLRNFESPELFMPQRYCLSVKGFETLVYFSVNKDNVVDTATPPKGNELLQLEIPLLSADSMFEANDFETINSDIEWKCSFSGNKEWKTACLVSFLKGDQLTFSELGREGLSKPSPVCLGFDALSMDGRYSNILENGDTLPTKRLLISLSSSEGFVNCYPETVVALSNFADNYLGNSTWSVSSGDYVSSRLYNLRSLLGVKLLEDQISPENPSAFVSFVWENNGLTMNFPLTKYPQLGADGNILFPERECLQFRNSKSSMAVDISPQDTYKLSIYLNALSVFIPEASHLGVKSIPDKSTGNIIVSMQETFKTAPSTEQKTIFEMNQKKKNQAVRQASLHASDHKGKLVITSCAFTMKTKYKVAPVTIERFVVPSQEVTEVKIGKVRGDIHLAQLQGVIRGIECFQTGLAILRSKNASIGGKLCRTTLVDLGESVPSYQAILGKNLQVNPAVVKCYVGTLVLSNFPKYYRRDKYSFFFEAMMDGQKFRSENAAMKNSQGSVTWEAMFSFITTSISTLTIRVFAKCGSKTVSLGCLHYLPETLAVCIRRNTASLGILVNSRGFNDGQIKNSLHWSYLSPGRREPGFLSTFKKSKVLEMKIGKLNQSASAKDIPLHTAIPNGTEEIVGIQRHTRKQPIRLSATISGCEVFPISFPNKLTEVEKNQYAERCFIFTNTSIAAEKKSNSEHYEAEANGLSPLERQRMAQFNEERRIFRKMSRYDKVSKAAQRVARLLYTQEAFRELAGKYNKKKINAVVDSCSVNLWSPRLDSVLGIMIPRMSITGKYHIAWKMLSNEDIEFRASLFQKIEERRRRKLSFTRDLNSMSFFEGSNWLQVSEISVRASLAYAEGVVDPQKATKRKTKYLDMFLPSKDEKVVVLRELLEKDVEELFSCVVKPRLEKKRRLSRVPLRRLGMEVLGNDIGEHSDDSSSFCSAVESRDAELKKAFQEGFLSRVVDRDIHFSVQEPLPLSPGTTVNELKCLQRYLPKFRLFCKPMVSSSVDLEDSDTDTIDMANSSGDGRMLFSHLLPIEEESLFKSMQTSLPPRDASSDEIQGVTIGLLVSGFLTSSVMSFLDDFTLVLEPISPSMQQIFDKAYVGAHRENNEAKREVSCTLSLHRIDLDFIQVSPIKTQRKKFPRECILRGHIGVHGMAIVQEAARNVVSYRVEVNECFSVFSAFGFDLVEQADAWCTLGRGAISNVVCGMTLDLEKKRRVQIGVEKVDFGFGSDLLCVLHSFLLRYVEEGLAVRDTFNAVQYRTGQQWAVTCGQIVKLMYSFSQFNVAGSSQVRAMKKILATKEWNKRLKPYKGILPVEQLLYRLKVLLEVLPERVQIESALGGIPFSSQPDMNDLPVELLTNVVFLKSHFNKQTWSDSMQLKAEGVFVNKLFESQYFRRSRTNSKTSTEAHLLNFALASVSLEIFGKQERISTMPEGGLEFQKTGSLSMKLKVQGIQSQFKMKEEEGVEKIYFKHGIQAVKVVANPLLIDLLLTVIQVQESLVTVYLAYTTLQKVHAKYHDSRKANRLRMENLLLSDHKLNLDDDMRSVTESVNGEGLERRSHSSVEEYDTMSWEDVKRNRKWKAELEWRKSLKAARKNRQEVDKLQRMGSLSSSVSTATNPMPMNMRIKRADTSNQGNIRRIARLSYEEGALNRLFPMSMVEEKLVTSPQRAEEKAAKALYVFGTFEIETAKFLLATQLPSSSTGNVQKLAFNPLLSLYAQGMAASISLWPSAEKFKSPSLMRYELSHCCSLYVSTVKLFFGEDLHSKKNVQDVAWVAHHIKCFASEGSLKKRPSHNMVHDMQGTVSEVKVFVEAEQSTVDVSNWQISAHQLQTFFNQWSLIYKDLRTTTSINKSFVARQNYLVYEISAEERRILSEKFAQTKPIQSWRAFRQNMYTAAKNTTASMEKYLVSGLNKNPATRSRYSFCFSLSDGLLKMSPTNKVALEYSVSKSLLNFNNEASHGLEALLNVGRSRITVSKSNGSKDYFKVIRQELPSFWIYQTIDTAGYVKTNTGKKLYNFDLKIIIQKVESELAPTIAQDLVSLQGDLADEILATLATIAKVTNQYKGQNISRQGPLQEGDSQASVAQMGARTSQSFSSYQLMIFVEGIKVKIRGAKEDIEHSWVGADSGGVQLLLEWKPKELEEEKFVIRLTKCILLFEGMCLKAFSPVVDSYPLLVGEATLSIEQVEDFSGENSKMASGVLISLPDAMIEIQPDCVLVFHEILSAYIVAFESYKVLLNRKSSVSKELPVGELEEKGNASATQNIVNTFSKIWQNLREPLGREIDNAATRLEWFNFSFLLENIKVAVLFGTPLKDEIVPILLSQVDHVDFQGIVQLKVNDSKDNKWAKTQLLGNLFLKQMTVSPAFGEEFPYLTANPVATDIEDIMKLPHINAAVKLSREMSCLSVDMGSPKIVLSKTFLLFVNQLKTYSRPHLGEKQDIIEGKEYEEDYTYTTTKLSLSLKPGMMEVLGLKEERVCCLPLPSWLISVELEKRTAYISAVMGAEAVTFNAGFGLYMAKLMDVLGSASTRENEKVNSGGASSSVDLILELKVHPLTVYYRPNMDNNSTMCLSTTSFVIEYSSTHEVSLMSVLLPTVSFTVGPLESAALRADLTQIYLSYGSSQGGKIFSVDVLDFNFLFNFRQVVVIDDLLRDQRQAQEEAPIYLLIAIVEEKNPIVDSLFAVKEPPSMPMGARWFTLLLKRVVLKCDFGEANFKIHCILQEVVIRKSNMSRHTFALSHIFAKLPRVSCNVLGCFSGSVDVDEDIELQGLLLCDDSPKDLQERFVIPHITASDLYAIFLEDRPSAVLSFQTFLLARKGLFAYAIKVPSMSCNLFAETRVDRTQVPVANLNFDGINLFLKESFDIVEEHLLVHCEIGITSIYLGITIDTIGDLLDILAKIPTVSGANEESPKIAQISYPSSLGAQGSVVLQIGKGDLSLRSGVTANALSAAAAAFSVTSLEVKWQNQLVGDKLCSESIISFVNSKVTRFQQLLASFGQLEGESSASFNSREKIISSQRRRRERTILAFPKTQIRVSTEQYIEWKSIYLTEVLKWEPILERAIKFTFHSTFAKTISVSTDLRDYAYLKELVSLLARKLRMRTETVAEQELEYIRRGGSGDFVFEPKLNVIGDATSLALGLVLSKLNIRKSLIPQYVHSNISAPAAQLTCTLFEAIQALSPVFK